MIAKPRLVDALAADAATRPCRRPRPCARRPSRRRTTHRAGLERAKQFVGIRVRPSHVVHHGRVAPRRPPPARLTFRTMRSHLRKSLAMGGQHLVQADPARTATARLATTIHLAGYRKCSVARQHHRHEPVQSAHRFASVDVDGSPVNSCCTECSKQPSPYQPKLPTTASTRSTRTTAHAASACRSRHVPMRQQQRQDAEIQRRGPDAVFRTGGGEPAMVLRESAPGARWATTFPPAATAQR